jgi:AraC-like DNA-binding protein
VGRVRLRTAGAHAVEETWQSVVPSARLHRVDPQRFAFDWHSVAVDGMTVVAYDLDASVRSAVDPEDQVVVCRLSTTDGGAWDEHGPLDARQPWVSADRAVRARWEGRARVHGLVFDRRFVDLAARRISGDDTLWLGPWDARPVSDAAGRHWQRTYRYLAETLLSEDDDRGELIEAELRRHAVHATLTAFSPAFLERSARAAQRRAAPATVRRAMAFIDEHAHEPITVDDVALAAGISTRGLQYAFRRAVDTTPTEWLRRARLSGAHRSLSDPDGGTVAEIARRWGFEHPSRFAAHYRAAYGVNPAQTLRAHR